MGNGSLSNRIFRHSRLLVENLPMIRKRLYNGILFVLITGCRWQDMSRSYGAYQTAWRRLKRWLKEGIWNRILASAQEKAYATGKLSLETIAVDSSLIDSKKVASPQGTTGINTARE
jgi:transposase